MYVLKEKNAWRDRVAKPPITIRIDPMDLKSTRGNCDRDDVHGPLQIPLAHYCNDARQYADTFIPTFPGNPNILYMTYYTVSLRAMFHRCYVVKK